MMDASKFATRFEQFLVAHKLTPDNDAYTLVFTRGARRRRVRDRAGHAPL